MVIDMRQYAGTCTCGREHPVTTREILIEAGATNRLGRVAGDLELREGVVVCDTNTRPYADRAVAALEGYLSEGVPLVELDAQGLHSDEKATAQLAERLPKGAGWMLAAGSGTIHDTVRYVAKQEGIPFLSFPTAASVDGFVSTMIAMTWYGFKTTFVGVAPLAVVADTDIFGKAPRRLTAAGIGDVLGKYTALIDWEVSHMVIGEGYCPRIVGICKEAVDNVLDNLDGIAAGDPDGMEKLLFALLLTGIAMQMWGDSRPASAAEHHFSHLWEIEVINGNTDALHGEKVGVGLLIALREYKRIAAREHLALQPYTGLPKERLKEKFGRLYEDMLKENTPDPLDEVDRDILLRELPAICEKIRQLPDPDALERAMAAAGCPTTIAQLGLPEEILADSMDLSPYIRSRLTVMRLRKLLDLS